MKHQADISHFLIEKDSDGYEITGTDRKFDTLLQLVDFYMTDSVSGESAHYVTPSVRSRGSQLLLTVVLLSM